MTTTEMADLNQAQREAATHGDGSVLVIAGAGTGKTRTLAARVAHLIDRGTDPQRILLLTFTRRAAQQMLARAAQLVERTAAAKVWGGTFHATANRLLRHYGKALGLASQFTVADQADAADLMNLIRSELGLAKTQGRRRFASKDTLVAIYSRTVNSRTHLKAVLEQHFPWCAADQEGIGAIFEVYTQRKRQQGVLDYDDLLLYWKALCEAPGTGQAVADRFDHVLVDEYQDTNVAQAEILAAMRRTNKNLMVVGDDAQAIYSFRAATIRNILDFPDQFPGTRIVKLEENYRSTQPILDVSNAVMAAAPKQYRKRLFTARAGSHKPTIITCADEAEQCDLVCDRVLAKREEGVSLRRQAVLFRAGHHSDQLEVALSRRNIPFVKYGGLKFVEAAHVKDLIAVLRIAANPLDELSWYRVLQLLAGIGPATARRLMDALDVKPSGDAKLMAASPPMPLTRLAQAPPAVPVAAREEFESLRSALADCSGVHALAPAAQVARVRRFYEPIFERIYENPTARLRDLEQLEQIAGRYKSVIPFLTDLSLDPPSSTQDLAGPPLLDDDYLILSTIHSAKGCEWDVVFIIHAADGMIPSDMATGDDEQIEEERRLLYVAVTRARDTLEIYFPLRYYRTGRGATDSHSYAQLSRFIDERTLTLVDRRTGPGASAEVPGGSVAAQPQVIKNVDAMLSNLWG